MNAIWLLEKWPVQTTNSTDIKVIEIVIEIT